MESSKKEIKPNPSVNPLEKDDIVIAVDSTDIKVTNRGEWILENWKNKRIRKGFFKIHATIDIRTKKIASMFITKEDIHD